MPGSWRIKSRTVNVIQRMLLKQLPSEEAWNTAHTWIYAPQLSSSNHKQIWQNKVKIFLFCFEEEKYAKSYSFCWLTARSIVCCFSVLVLHIPTYTWEQILNCNLIAVIPDISCNKTTLWQNHCAANVTQTIRKRTNLKADFNSDMLSR